MKQTNNCRLRGVLAIACFLAVQLASGGALAEHPMYGNLSAGHAPANHPPYWTIGRHQPGEVVQPLHPRGYAYGWFGATGRPQASRQTGYYGLYRQWSFK